jgi:hypothetical protein
MPIRPESRPVRPTRSIPLLLLAVLAACDSPSSSAPGAPARMDVVSGDLQPNGVVGQELPAPLVVKVLDDDGDPVPNQLVNFVVTAGEGTVFAGSSQTNAQGEARERWTLGRSAADTQKVEVRAVDPTTGQARVFATFRALGAPGPAAQLERIPLSESTGAAGQTLPDSLSVRVRDQYGNPAPGATVTWAVASGGGSISPATMVSRADGTVKAAWTLGSAAGAQTARATLGSLTPVEFAASAVPGGPVTVEIVTPPLNFTSLLQEIPIQVTGRDAFGNAVAGAPVTLVVLNDQVVTLAANPARAVSRANGSTRIVASLQNGAADTVDVVVQQLAAFLMVGPDTSHLLVGESVTFWALAHDANRRAITNPAMTYASNAPAVASIQGGSAVANAVGTALITGTAASGIQDGARVEVYHAFSAQSVDAGDQATCAISGGTTYCWGSNNYGDLGTGDPVGTQVRTPRAVAGGVAFTQVWVGNLPGSGKCGLTSAGQAYCWGGYRFDFSRGPATPAPVPGWHTFTRLAVGASSQCGVTTGNDVYCWGRGTYGMLGNGDTVSTHTPVRVAANVPFADVAVGWRHACAVATNGTAYCWGANSRGETGGFPGSCFGDGGYSCHLTPQAVSGRSDFAEVAAGFQNTCALTAGGVAYCWGSNSGGALGIDRGFQQRYEPTAVTGGHTFTSLSDGYYHYCATRTGGEAYCWGSSGAVGLPAGTHLPGHVAQGLTFAAISAGGAHTCGVATGGGVYCWGTQNNGELGDGYQTLGSTTPRIQPVRVRVR